MSPEISEVQANDDSGSPLSGPAPILFFLSPHSLLMVDSVVLLEGKKKKKEERISEDMEMKIIQEIKKELGAGGEIPPC